LHVVTDHRHAPPRQVVAVGQKASTAFGPHVDVAHLAVGVGGTEYLRGGGLRAVAHLVDAAGLRVEDRREPGDAVHALGDQLHVVRRDAGDAPLQTFGERRIGLNGQTVGAKRLELLVDGKAEALDQRHGGDHGRHADDDAERGEKTAETVRPDRLQGGAQAFQNVE